jgi:hypothetical protein
MLVVVLIVLIGSKISSNSLLGLLDSISVLADSGTGLGEDRRHISIAIPGGG